VPIDGVNDDTGQFDQLPVSGQKAFVDTPDPTFDLMSAVNRPEEVAGTGNNGALVYIFEFKGATSLENADAVPYYRDDACLDDGTGDDTVPRPWPGEDYGQQKVKDGYRDYWRAHTGDNTLQYTDLACNPTGAATLPEYKRTPFQGAFASHGIHFFVTHDSDNAQQPVTVDEIDGQQWRYAVPLSAPANVIGGDMTKPNYALNVISPLQVSALPYGEVAPSASVPEVPLAVLLPFVAIAVIGGTAWSRRRAVAV
jgi:hypothetical protein